MFNLTIIDNVLHIQISINLIANGFIYLAGLLWGIELCPQVIKTVKTKNIEGLSPAYFKICFSAYILYAIGNMLLGNWNIVIAHIPSLTLLLVMLTLLVRYRKNEKNKRKI